MESAADKGREPRPGQLPPVAGRSPIAAPLGSSASPRSPHLLLRRQGPLFLYGHRERSSSCSRRQGAACHSPHRRRLPRAARSAPQPQTQTPHCHPAAPSMGQRRTSPVSWCGAYGDTGSPAPARRRSQTSLPSRQRVNRSCTMPNWSSILPTDWSMISSTEVGRW